MRWWQACVVATCAGAAALAACGDAGTTDDGGAASGTTSGGGPATSAAADGGGASDGASKDDGCKVGDAVCVAHDRRRACVASGGGSTWLEETCAAGAGCFRGVCTPGKCSDACTLGAAQGGKTCAPWSIVAGKAAASDPATKLHDRARGYLAEAERGAMLAGGIGSPRWADPPSYTKVTSMEGIGDSALWTGTFLAAEALRLRATGAADARARVLRLVDTMHLWLNVAGEPGMLVRWAKESSTSFPFAIGDYDCSAQRVHCGVPYGAKTYDFVGHISRDQYQGVMLGLALAYEALTSADEAARETIRKDVVTFVKELMKERSLPLAITYKGVALPVTNVPIRFVVVSPREMQDGKAFIEIGASGDKSASMYGFQEFIPDLSDVLRHVPGIGLLGGAIPIPRASSAIMLASFFRVALAVTDGAPAWAKDRAEIYAYYTGHAGEGGNVKDWLAVAKQWNDGGGCGGDYYGNNITMMPMYDLARLEDDPARAAIVKDDVLGARLWPAFAPTKNSFFSFIYAAVGSAPPADVAAGAIAQLGGFPPAPRVHRAVDLRSSPKYPSHDPTCADEVDHATAVDVADRPAADFLWQRQPWGLYDPGDPAQTYPGVDYLVAYFLGRRHALLDDDTAGTCLVWQ